MKIVDSNKRYGTVIAGILLVFVVSIFVVSALGVGDYSLFSENNIHSREMLFIQDNDDIVSVAYSGELEDLETEPGTLEIVDFDYDYEDSKLPLCLTNAELSDWQIIVKSYGGYVPVTWWADQEAEIYQEKDLFWFWCYDVPVGSLEISWEKYYDYTDGDDECPECCTYWKGTFSLECGEVICLDSSQYPTVEDTNVDGEWNVDKSGSIGCCNDVSISITSDWKPACGPLSCSRFELILAKK
jgi:hypothetical protein